MKKIIDNRLYDTCSARLIAHYEASYPVSDSHFYSETLYRKRTGEYFLCGKGNADSQYAERIDRNTWIAGVSIVPLPYNRALKWAEEHMDVEDFEGEFGSSVKDDTRTTIHLSVSAAGAERARRIAARRGVSFSSLVDDFFASLHE